MLRATKWKFEKTTVKVVFRLQFHATHIPQPGWDKLFVSLIAADSGKVTAKTTKANVRNGSCKWPDPVYETTRLLQDAKTKKYDEKLYKLVVSMGSSRASLLGEANINLADYVGASKPASVSLSLHGCNFGSLLHVTVQLLTSKTCFREFEQQREFREKRLHTSTSQSVRDVPSGKIKSSAGEANDQLDEMNSRTRFESDSIELASFHEKGENEDYMDSAVGIDGSSHTSESMNVEKHDILSAHEVDSLNSPVSTELGRSSPRQSLWTGKVSQCGPPLLTNVSSNWVHGWSSDYSTDNDLTTAYEENSSLKGSLEAVEMSVSELKLEVSSLQSHADVLGADTQKFAQELAAEIALGEKLSRELLMLKSECLKIKDDIQKLKDSGGRQGFNSKEIELLSKDVCWMTPDCTKEVASKNHNRSPSLSSHAKVPPASENYHLLEDAPIDFEIGANDIKYKQDGLAHNLEMRWLQGLSLLDDTIREIQNKACLRYQGRDLTLLPYLEALQSVLQQVKGLTLQLTPVQNMHPAERINPKALGVASVNIDEALLGGGQGSVVEHHLEDMLPSSDRPHQLSHEPGPVQNDLEAASTPNEKIAELSNALEVTEAERDSLMRKMNHMKCYYEAAIQELTESQKQMLDELQDLRNEHSACIYTISDLKSQIEIMHQDRNERLQISAEDMSVLGDLNKELEKRAITSETALKRLRWNYSIAVGQLQKDLELLSFQVLSLFETNEKLTRQNFAEASEQCCQEYSEELSVDVHSCLQKDDLVSASLKEQYKIKLQGVHPETALPIGAELGLPSNFCVPPAEAGEKLNYNVAHLMGNKDFSLEKVLMHAETICKDDKCIGLPNQFDCISGNTEPAELLCPEIPCKEMERSLCFQEKLCWKSETELSEMHALNLHLEVFSYILQETLHEANVGIRLMMKEMDEAAQKLESSTMAKESLVDKLQSSLGDLEALRMSEAKSISKFNDLTLKNCTLEGKLQGVSDENCLLTQKVAECERLIDSCFSYKSKYEACSVEKNHLENLLKQETLEINCLRTEVSSLDEELKTLRAEFIKQSSVKDNLESTIALVKSKLGELCCRTVSCNEQTVGPTLTSKSPQQESDDMSVFSYLEDLQQSVYAQIHQLTEEKDMKQKFELIIADLVMKLDVANNYAEKLQLDLQDAEDKLIERSAAVEQHAEQNRGLSSKLSVTESALQCVSSENKDLAQKILILDSVQKELEQKKVAFFDSTHENETSKMSLESGHEESLQLEEEISGLKQSLRCTHDELQSSRGLINELEAEVRDLTAQLNQKHEQILSYADQNAESIHLRQRLSDLELEMERMKCLLFHSKECQRKVDEDSSFHRREVTDLETNLGAMHERLLAAEVEAVFAESQFRTRLQELVEGLHSLKACNKDPLLKQLDVVTKLNGHMAGKAQCLEENTKLMATLQSLRFELETIVREKRVLEDDVIKRSAMWAELKNYENMVGMVEVEASQEKLRDANDIEQLKLELSSSQEEIDSLLASKNELEIIIIVLGCKLDELHAQASLLDEYAAELMKLHSLKLEGMKEQNVTSLLPHHEHNSNQDLRGLQKELFQLCTANEQLGNVLPSFNKFPSSENASERVLALELELAEVLQAKKKSVIHFQSSFVKQHSDGEAIFKSLTDINDLIKDTLEVKRRYMAVQTELKDMQERYTELSLQFAEVEGRRRETATRNDTKECKAAE